MYYNQCTLELTENSSVTRQVSWLPEKFAIHGKQLKLKENGEWKDGWIVTGVGTRLHEDHLPDPHDDIKGHRKMTGDSMPKRQRLSS